jgi:hypothetical protein
MHSETSEHHPALFADGDEILIKNAAASVFAVLQRGESCET